MALRKQARGRPPRPADAGISVDDLGVAPRRGRPPKAEAEAAPVKRPPGRPPNKTAPTPRAAVAAAAVAADNPPDAPVVVRRGRPPGRLNKAKAGKAAPPTVHAARRSTIAVNPPVRTRTRRDPTVIRDPLRGPQRDPQTGRVVIVRNGKTYTRRVVTHGDKFHVDAADIPDGMSYQWIAASVLGLEQRNSMAGYQQNGWEAVDLSRYPGRYAPVDATGPIIIDGLMLVERPIELTMEARDEEITAAKQLIRTRNDQFTPKLPDALDRRGTGLKAKRSIEGMPTDIGRPSYEIAVDDGLL